MSVCTLSYPERFYAAVAFAAQPPESAKSVGDETRLLLYALFQQATLGPCDSQKPWSWNVIENAKWNSWKQLNNMPSTEAMRLYVRTLEEDNPNWWALLTEGKEEKALAISQSAAAAAAAAMSGQEAVISIVSSAPTSNGPASAIVHVHPLVQAAPALGKWTAVPTSGDAPRRRYEHAATYLGGRMYIIGGNSNGRLLSDTAFLDIRTLTWQRVDAAAGSSEGAALPSSSAPSSASEPPPPPPTTLPPIAGHVAVAWKTSIIVAGGHTKDGRSTFEVYSLDVNTGAWTQLQPSGAKPSSRGGHTATLIGDRLWVFGGEDRSRRALGDVHCLDLAQMAWASPKTTGAVPAPRTGHTAAAHGEFLFVFGGGSTVDCFSDLKVLNTATLQWTAVVPLGTPPKPRAGCSSAVINGIWYICGGGDGSGPRKEMLSLSLTAEALEWVIFDVDAKGPLAREGLSVLAVPGVPGGGLVAFGGYDGKYHCDLSCLRPGPADDCAAVPSPATRAAPAGPKPATQAEPAAPAAKQAAPAPPPAAPAKASEAAGHDHAAHEVAAAKEAASTEIALMRRQLAATQQSLAETEKQLSAARTDLAAEQARVLRTEADLAESKQRVAELEAELREVNGALKKANAAAEAAAEAKPAASRWW